MQPHPNNATDTWQDLLQSAITDPETLIDTLRLPKHFLPGALRAAKLFQLLVPLPYLSRIERGNPNDPLLKQVLPLDLEEITTPNYVIDPLEEADVNPLPGMLHKYDGRVLLTISGHCAIHCRYCFRRHFPYGANTPGKLGWLKVFQAIQQDESVEEVILSGGDPLTLPDKYLAWFFDHLNAIAHLKRIRFHTRLPIVIPQRITVEFLNTLKTTSKQIIIVIHVNHPNELDVATQIMLKQLYQAGAVLLNQSVLLKGVNDCADTLITLHKRLFEQHVLPYYLHTLDKVQGTAHFEVPDTQIHALYHEIVSKSSGYLVPKFVKEVPKAASKIALIL